MILLEKKEEKDFVLQNTIEIVSSYKNDPFVGDLSTPINNSRIVRTYLKFLPLYNKELSPFFRGCMIGIFHGYFLFGPFMLLGPLRNTEASYFLGFLDSLSFLIIINIFSFLYGHVVLSHPYGLLTYGPIIFQNKMENLNILGFHLSFGKMLNYLINLTWNIYISGFSLGSFTGVSFAYIFCKFFFPIDF